MFRTTLLAATLALTFANVQADTAKQPLQMKVYNADGNSFHANSTLIYGEKEAIVIDAGFTRADALRIGANVLDSGKQLKTIFVSQADPDYYFGVEVLKEMFPDAEVVATPAVLAKISSKLDGKVAFWGPKMGVNAPKSPVLPTALKGDTLTVDGQKIEIRGTTGPLAHRPYVWIPSIKTITGNVGVLGGLHVWTADTQNAAERMLWIAQLDEMAALKPEVVVPGHMQAGSKLDASNIAYTKQYLQTFEKNAAAAKDSAELIASMKKAYPDAGLGIALEIGAKVNKGEMKW
ncbi:MBL fold metallo-hydrolase [Deefgea tanakiae]|jgi:glyoxylase-like metal-dependent hydrolase (beta-lactamase superfamily II)|uniref:MBL fold metallo-hydrolase n=1 Tax=Deefgea tanakiae TaxID=2865840 RepID=A0ABX8Z538_9NEIS|nr:MBL fold metallo-hydrolase [Deefgea tanakiae]QZA77688.1 MBL fold metallo-hydrolase [Deefgea tanakiae]